MSRKLILKTIIAIIVIYLSYSNWLFGEINTLIVNKLALMQMQNTPDSSVWIHLYTSFDKYKILIIIAFMALLYKKEIFTVVKEKKK